MQDLSEQIKPYVKNKIKNICKDLDICYVTWRRKVKGQSDFYLNEIKILVNNYGIPIEIFIKE